MFSDPQGKAAAIDQLAKLQGCVTLCIPVLIDMRSSPHHDTPPLCQCTLPVCRYVRKRIGQTMSLRLTPEIRFIYDEAHDRGERVRF